MSEGAVTLPWTCVGPCLERSPRQWHSESMWTGLLLPASLLAAGLEEGHTHPHTHTHPTHPHTSAVVSQGASSARHLLHVERLVGAQVLQVSEVGRSRDGWPGGGETTLSQATPTSSSSSSSTYFPGGALLLARWLEKEGDTDYTHTHTHTTQQAYSPGFFLEEALMAWEDSLARLRPGRCSSSVEQAL